MNTPPRPRPRRGDPGLDPAHLAALRRPHPAEHTLPDRITRHLAAHDGYVAFSGGKDSLVALHLALQVDPAVPVAWFDSGLEFPETRDYIHTLTTDWDLNLHIYPAKPTALELLIASGAWDHHAADGRGLPDLHEALIANPAARAHTDHGPGEIWGVRAEESRGRRLAYNRALRAEVAQHCHTCCPAQPAQDSLPNTAKTHRSATSRLQRSTHGGIIRRLDATTAFGPIWDWTTHDVWAYIHRHQLTVNPVYEILTRLGAPQHLHRVGHLIDGNNPDNGRITILQRGWPALFHDLAEALPRLREF